MGKGTRDRAVPRHIRSEHKGHFDRISRSGRHLRLRARRQSNERLLSARQRAGALHLSSAADARRWLAHGDARGREDRSHRHREIHPDDRRHADRVRPHAGSRGHSSCPSRKARLGGVLPRLQSRHIARHALGGEKLNGDRGRRRDSGWRAAVALDPRLQAHERWNTSREFGSMETRT